MKPFVSKAELITSMDMMGDLLSFLATGDATGGRSAFFIHTSKPGNEPPPHLHEREHETFFILEGILEFYCDGKIMLAGPGELVFLPANVAHAFFIRTASAKMLTCLQASGNRAVGLDKYLAEVSKPAESMAIAEESSAYTGGVPEKVITSAIKNGIKMLSPEEVTAQLPDYPGFGTKRDLIYA